MRKKTGIVNKIAAAVLLALMCGFGGDVAHGQLMDRIKRHVNADPLTFSGSVGTTLQSIYNNNDVYAAASPFAYTAFADFNIGIYGFNLPIHINLLNISATQFSFPQPEININVTPQWRNFRFHFGTSSMNFSKYTYSGQNFSGVGAEYQGKLLRFAGFYGVMQAATQIREYDRRNAIQYMADSLLGLNITDADLPQLKRVGYGARLGIGSSKNYLDLNLFKAKDDSTSLPRFWHTMDSTTAYRDSLIMAKENLAVGVSGRVSIGKWFNLTANAGASLFTPDQRSTAINSESLAAMGMADSTDQQMNKVLGILDKVSWLYEPRLNSFLRFAGDAAATFNFSHVNAVLTYRLVQADYTSLGTTRFSQNAHGVGGNTNFRLFKGSTTLGLSGYLQRDNLDGKQLYTNQVITYSANVATVLFEQLDLSVSYSGVKQDQMDGTRQVNDTTRVDQLAHNLTVSPTYTFAGDDDHSISLNFNMVQNQNLNPLMTVTQDVNTYTAGVGYGLSLTGLRMDIGANYDFSRSISPNNSYNSHAFGANFAYSVVKTDKVNLKLNYVMSLSFNDNEDDDFEGVYDPEDPVATAKTSTFSFSNRLGLAFNYKKNHNAQLYLSSSNYSENIVIGQKITTDFDLRINFSYSYTFAKRIIKSKKAQDEDSDEPSLEG